MTPKEKAEAIKKEFQCDFDLFYYDENSETCIATGKLTSNSKKQCSIIAVKLAMQILEAFGYEGAMYDDFDTGNIVTTSEVNPCDYWQKVIENI